jgi:replicative superfamily II helicase
MSLAITYDPDDLPAGYPNQWEEMVRDMERFGTVSSQLANYRKNRAEINAERAANRPSRAKAVPQVKRTAAMLAAWLKGVSEEEICRRFNTNPAAFRQLRWRKLRTTRRPAGGDR